MLEEEHGKKQKKLPWNKNLNLDSATIFLGTCKNKCKVVDLEGGNVIKSNYVVEFFLLHPPIKGSHNRALSICTFVSNTFFMSFDYMAALDVKHRPISKVNLVKPPLVRSRMQKKSLICHSQALILLTPREAHVFGHDIFWI